VGTPVDDPLAARCDRSLVDRLQEQVIGRHDQLEVVVAALAAGRHVLLEGPPGTGKSTLLRSIASCAGLAFEFVEGNAELTPARLVGHFDPALVLNEGYSPDVFVEGPLVAALRNGSLLYVEELNRVPEETLNTLITVMAERELHVPRLGRVDAAPGFRLVAAMNPFDAIGTARISSAVYDRVCRVAVGYQGADDEARIVRAATGAADTPWLHRVVDLVRRTRSHPDVRIGSSVRGAIDLVAVASTLAGLRGADGDDLDVTRRSALAALSGRVRLREGSTRTAEDVIEELVAAAFAPPPEAAADGPGGDAPGEAPAPGRAAARG